MVEKITVYQKPTCSKCRETVKLLKERGVEFEAVNYYERPVTADELRGLLEKLGLSPRDILRRDEPVARSLGINRREVSDDEMIQLMVENPDLIQRPIVVRGKRAVLARPVANIDELFGRIPPCDATAPRRASRHRRSSVGFDVLHLSD